MGNHRTLLAGSVRVTMALALLLTITLTPTGIFAQRMTERPDRVQAARMAGKQTAHFIENRGQWDPQAKFLLRSPGLDMWITDNGPVYDLYTVTGADNARDNDPKRSASILGASAHQHPSADLLPQRGERQGHVVRVTFEGRTSAVALHGTDRQQGVHNYFIGNDRTKWATNVPLYAGARASRLYDGIDAVYYLDGGRPRYDLIVAPGADPAAVRMRIEGATAIGVTPAGALSIATSVGSIEQRELYAYQEISGARQQVACRFVVDGKGEVRFDLGKYDRTRPLVIDPLVYSTYLGGSGQDYVYGIAVDGSGNAYVTGETSSTNFPTSGPYQSSYSGGSRDAFVTKLSSSGSTLDYSTYLGGSGTDAGLGIAVDGSGNAYVTGETYSTNFPTSGAYQSSRGGAGSSSDAFVTKLSSTGSTLAYSTYLGGSNADRGNAIALDGSGNAYIAGYTTSTNFPTSGAYQSTYGGSGDAFITKLSGSGSALAYSTYLGGSSGEFGLGVAVDASGNVYVTGQTSSTNFPTSGAYQSSGGGSSPDAFVTKLSSSGSTLTYSTYLGGSREERGNGIAVDGSGDAYVTGSTSSPNFPTSGAYQSSGGVDYYDPDFQEYATDAFVTKLSSTGSTLSYSTYLGGSDFDGGLGIAVDASGNAYVIGYTGSTNFPTWGAYQSSPGGSNDAFVTKLSSTGSALAYSTYLGGSNSDAGHGIAVDGSGDAYVAGVTGSTNFPTSGACQASSGGSYDAFVTKLSSPTILVGVTAPNGGESWCAGTSQSITWTSSGVTNVKVEISDDGGTSWSVITASTPASNGSYTWSIPAGQADGSNYRVRVSDASDATIADVGNSSFTIDNQPPTLTLATDAVLWPANHSYTTFTVSSIVTGVSDNCTSGMTGSDAVIWKVTSDEEENDGADGNTVNDIVIASDCRSVQLRSERASNGNGRVYRVYVRATDDNGNTSSSETYYMVSIPRTQNGTAVDDDVVSNEQSCGGGAKPSVARAAAGYLLMQNHPNPFSAVTSIEYTVPAPSQVSLVVYDASGNSVATIVDQYQTAGRYTAAFDGSTLASGTYTYLLRADATVLARTMVLVR